MAMDPNSPRDGVPNDSSLQATAARRRAFSRTLAAACLCAAFALAGCGSDFQTAQADQSANQKIQEAARIAASAGEPRAKAQLVEDADGGDLASLQSKIAANRGQYIVQKSIEDDLNAALKMLPSASDPDLSSATKSSVEAESGEIQLRLSQQKLTRIQADLDDLAAQGMRLGTLAQAAAALNNQAKSISDASPAGVPAEDVTQAQKALVEARAAAANDDQKVRSIQEKMVTARSQAQQIYAQTDAAFLAADKLKGQAAIDAGNKAMEDRKQAEDLMVQAGNLEADLAVAQAQLAISTLDATQAEQKLSTAQAASDDSAAFAKGNAGRAAALKKAADGLVNGDDGVAARFKTFSALAAKIDGEIKSAAADADHAASGFGSAASDFTAFRKSFQDRIEKANLDSADPVVKFSKDERFSTLLKWSQANAQIQSGQVNLAGYQAAKIASLAATQAAAAGVSDAASPISGKDYQSAAAARFATAAQTASSIDSGRANPDVDKIKWIGYSLEALAYHGQSLTDTDDKAQASAQTALSKIDNADVAGSLGWIKQ